MYTESVCIVIESVCIVFYLYRADRSFPLETYYIKNYIIQIKVTEHVISRCKG